MSIRKALPNFILLLLIGLLQLACSGRHGGSSQPGALAAPAIAYAPASYSLTVGTPVTTLSPGSTGGAVASWSISPALPTGLTFSTSTGAISGTPTAASAATTYTVTATNATGHATATITITVAAALLPPSIAYSPGAQTLVVGTAITPWTPMNTGGTAASWSINPALPAGLTFSTSTGAISGMPTAASASATYSVTASNAAGSSPSATITIVVTATLLPPGIAYVPSSQTFATGTAITPWTPTNTGGVVASWSIAPTTLPAGLAFSASTGQVTGTPTAASASTTYTVTATNATGHATATITITVTANATVMSYTSLYDSQWITPWVAAIWNNATMNPSAPVPVGHTGTAALECSYTDGWTATGLGQPWNDANPPQMNEARTLEFDIYFVPGSAAPDPLTFIVNDAGLSDEPTLVSLIPGWSALSSSQRFGQWFHVSIDLASVHPTQQDLSRFLFFDNSGSGGIHFFLASVRLGYVNRTTPPVLTMNSVQLSSDYSQLTLAFTSDEGMVYHADYGVGSYAQTIPQDPNKDYALTGTVTLTGLTPGSTVQYRVVATDHRIDPTASPNQGTLADTYAVPAAPTAPPVLSGLAVSGITGNQAQLAWTTDRPCTAVVTYQSSGGAVMTRALTDLSSNPTLVLDLLEPSTHYSVGLTVTDAFNLSASASTSFTTGTASTPTVTITVNPDTSAWTPISPYIYGLNFYSQITDPSRPRNLTLERMGGNRWTAYNWETNASNAGSDYLYESDDYLSSSTVPGEAVRSFIAADRAQGIASLMTVQLQGYVAADESGPVATPFPNLTRFFPVTYQKGSAFANPPSTTDGHVYMDEFLEDLKADFSGVDIYTDTVPTFVSLDNEPELWGDTHAEIQSGIPDPEAYIQKTISLTTALKDVEPAVVTFGPVHYGFNGIVNWQSTLAVTGTDWFTDKYLLELKAASTTAGKRLLDVYDFHWYSSAMDSNGNWITDLQGTTLNADQVQAIVQSSRSLWDPTYTENSWIAQYLSGPVNIVNRLQTKIDADWPGTGIAITEYDNGGDQHIAGAIAQADNLGAFGRLGLKAATMWPMSPSQAYPSAKPSFIYAGFKMYRDFDGHLGTFGDKSIPATSSNNALVTAYLSQDSTTAGRYVVVALNRSTAYQDVAITGLPAASGTAKVYRLDGTAAVANPTPTFVGQVTANLSSWVVTLPPLSVSTIEIQ